MLTGESLPVDKAVGDKGIPLAAGILYPWTGWQLSPVLASAAMSRSRASPS